MVLWRAAIYAPDSLRPMAEQVLQQSAVAVSSIVSRKGLWLVEAIYLDTPPADLDIKFALIAELAQADDILLPPLELMPVPDEDWLSKAYRPQGELRFGRLSVDDRDGHWSRHRLKVTAATAFGSGEHATTAMCLGLLTKIRDVKITPQNILDLGCGSGILALAAARLWPKAAVLASDIDPEAVRVTESNARRNYLRSRLMFCGGRGIYARPIQLAAPYNLILANILARPLRRLAVALSGMVCDGGRIMLSGLLDTQIRLVLNAYLPHGFVIERQQTQNGWAALLLVKKENN